MICKYQAEYLVFGKWPIILYGFRKRRTTPTLLHVRDVHYIIHGVANRTKPNQKPIEPNRSIGVRLVRQSNIIELELFCEFD